MLISLIIIVFVFMFLFALFFSCYKIFKILDRKILFDRYVIIFTIFEESKRIALEKIWQEKIFVYSANGVKAEKVMMDSLQKEYIHNVFLFSGENIIKDVLSVYGGMNALCLNLASEFVVKINDRESQVGKLLEVDNDLEMEN